MIINMSNFADKIYPYNGSTAYTTKDGSIIRELVHPLKNNGIGAQSLAEATVNPHEETALHTHALSEEIYHITCGSGEITMGEQRHGVTEGDSILIPPGMAHKIRNTGSGQLIFLCCCTPAYSHEDTELL